MDDIPGLGLFPPALKIVRGIGQSGQTRSLDFAFVADRDVAPERGLGGVNAGTYVSLLDVLVLPTSPLVHVDRALP